MKKKLHLFADPSEHSTISTGRVGACEVHRVGAASSRTLADIAVVSHRHEHEFMVQIVLPEEDFCLGFVSSKTDITSDPKTCAEDIAAVLTLKDYLILPLVYDAETGLRSVVFCICVI